MKQGPRNGFYDMFIFGFKSPTGHSQLFYSDDFCKIDVKYYYLFVCIADAIHAYWPTICAYLLVTLPCAWGEPLWQLKIAVTTSTYPHALRVVWWNWYKLVMQHTNNLSFPKDYPN